MATSISQNIFYKQQNISSPTVDLVKNLPKVCGAVNYFVVHTSLVFQNLVLNTPVFKQ